MSGEQYSITWSAVLSPTTSQLAIGQCLVFNASTQAYDLSTSANRGSKRSRGIALTSGDSLNKTVIMQSNGPLPATISGLGAGIAAWVRVSTTGVLERCSPSGSDDVVGWCETDGSMVVAFGFLTAAMIAGGGGGGFTPPTGTGPIKVSGGILVSVATRINLADTTNDVTGVLPLANEGAPTGTGIATVTSGAWDAASAPYPLAIAKGGTHQSALGSALQVLRTNAGATDTEWATIGSFSNPTGSGFLHNTGGALDGAARAVNLGTADITGTLGVFNGGTGASSYSAGIIHTPGGTSALTSSLIVDADVSGSAAIASSKLAAPGSNTQVMYNASGTPGADSGFLYGSGIATLSTALKMGGAPSASGAIRMTNGTFITQDNGSGTDVNVIGCDAATSVVEVGDAFHAAFVVLNATTISGTTIGGGYVIQYDSSKAQNALPIYGYASANSPWSGMNGTARPSCTAGGTITAVAADYCMTLIKLTGTPGAGFNYDLPTVASVGQAYAKYIWNKTNSTATIRQAGGGGSTASLTTNQGCWVFVDDGGCHQLEAGFTVT